jgi:hypothetical protein
MITDDRGGQALVGDHSVFDRVTQIDDARLGLGENIILALRRALVLLIDYLLVEDIDFPNHEEPQILDDVRRQGLIRNGVALYVESKPLALNAPAIRKLNGEIEADALVYHATFFMTRKAPTVAWRSMRCNRASGLSELQA